MDSMGLIGSRFNAWELMGTRKKSLRCERNIYEVQQLCDFISSHAVDKSPVNISDVLFAFSNEYDHNISQNFKLSC